MTRLGVDIDGVIYNFVDKLREYIHEVHAKPIEEMPPANTWSFFEDQWGFSLQEYLDMISEGVKAKELFWRGEQIPGALDGVLNLYRSGYEIVFITARGYHGLENQCLMATQYWLNHNGFPFHELIIDSDKTKYDLDILIDDSPSNYEFRHNMGLETLVFDQLWNQHLVSAPRAEGWSEVVKFIKENYKPGCYSEFI